MTIQQKMAHIKQGKVQFVVNKHCTHKTPYGDHITDNDQFFRNRKARRLKKLREKGNRGRDSRTKFKFSRVNRVIRRTPNINASRFFFVHFVFFSVSVFCRRTQNICQVYLG